MHAIHIELPPLPVIGHPPTHYHKLSRRAEKAGDSHSYHAAKVGQYISAALAPGLPWEMQRRYFRHAIHGHCNPPPVAVTEVYQFYDHLQDMVQRFAGEEAIRAASRVDDRLEDRFRAGQSRESLRQVADEHFRSMFGDPTEKPDYLSEDDWHQIEVLRKQWV